MSWDLINSAIDGEATSDEFGRTVTISGDGSVIAVSAPDGNGGKGEVTLYTNNGGSWDIYGQFEGSAGSDFGGSLSLSDDGKIVAIGSTGNGTDRVIINRYVSPGVWETIGRLSGNNNYGSSVLHDGTILAVGSDGDNSLGKTEIYQYSAGTWAQLGADIDGELDLFGASESF